VGEHRPLPSPVGWQRGKIPTTAPSGRKLSRPHTQPHLEEDSPIPILEPDRNGDRWGFPYPPHPPQIHKCNEIFRMGTLDGLPKSPQNHNVRARNSMDDAIFSENTDVVYGIHPIIRLKGFDFRVKKQLNMFLKLKKDTLNIRFVFNKIDPG
jgi:hypothetical protein